MRAACRVLSPCPPFPPPTPHPCHGQGFPNGHTWRKHHSPMGVPPPFACPPPLPPHPPYHPPGRHLLPQGQHQQCVALVFMPSDCHDEAMAVARRAGVQASSKWGPWCVYGRDASVCVFAGFGLVLVDFKSVLVGFELFWVGVELVLNWHWSVLNWFWLVLKWC